MARAAVKKRPAKSRARKVATKRMPPAGKRKSPPKKAVRAIKPARKTKLPVDTLNWVKIEQALFDLCARTIAKFAALHPGEVFYALFFDFPEAWSNIRIHLNTPARLRSCAEMYIRSNPEHYTGRSIEGVANDIRWEPGDFAYFDINATPTWKRSWNPVQALLIAAAAKQKPEVYATGDFVELRFLLTASRVLIRLEREGALEVLPQTRNFRTCCMRHEERPDDAWRRLAALRRDMMQPT